MNICVPKCQLKNVVLKFNVNKITDRKPKFLSSKICFGVPKTKISPMVSNKNIIMTTEKKGGRPKLNPSVKLKYVISVKLSTFDFYNLKSKSTEAGISCTELARMAIVGCRINQRLSIEQMQCIRALANIGNNLNQLARCANTTGYDEDVHMKLMPISDSIDAILNEIRK